MVGRRRRAELENEWLSTEEQRRNFIAKYEEGSSLGLYGWRRRCLFIVLTFLLLLVVFNLALTLWIFKVMEFSSDGLGPLRVVSGGIQLRGEALVVNNLVASKIRSRKGQAMRVESSRNITLLARTPEGRVNQILLGEGGATFHGSVQTPLVRAESGHELRLESPTRTLEILAPLGIAIESRAGDISATCLSDLKFQSTAGSVRLDAPNIYMPKLETASVVGAKLPAAGGSTMPEGPPRLPRPEVYQVCVCGKGRLFLAPPEGPCVADNDVCR